MSECSEMSNGNVFKSFDFRVFLSKSLNNYIAAQHEKHEIDKLAIKAFRCTQNTKLQL